MKLEIMTWKMVEKIENQSGYDSESSFYDRFLVLIM